MKAHLYSIKTFKNISELALLTELQLRACVMVNGSLMLKSQGSMWGLKHIYWFDGLVGDFIHGSILLLDRSSIISHLSETRVRSRNV